MESYQDFIDVQNDTLDLSNKEIRKRIYEDKKTVRIRRSKDQPDKIKDEADYFFDNEIVLLKSFKNNKAPHKRTAFRQLYQALQKARVENACVSYSRNYNKIKNCKYCSGRGDNCRRCKPQVTRMMLQVIEHAVELGLCKNLKSNKCSPTTAGWKPKRSRLLPLKKLEQFTHTDSWEISPPTRKTYVQLRKRTKKGEPKILLPFDKDEPTARRTHEVIDRTMAVNEKWLITYIDDENINSRKHSRLRSNLLAIFTDDFDHHGRIYCEGNGHIDLSEDEKATIRFDEYESVQLDFAAIHTNIAYNLEGMDLNSYPYHLWGSSTTVAETAVAKKVMNVSYNATTRKSALLACHKAKSLRTGTGRPKQDGTKGLQKAKDLNAALAQSGLTFKGVYERAKQVHSPISKYFGSDAGMRIFMRVDSKIALDVLDHFSARGVPILPCHDSFIVPAEHEAELTAVMRKTYKKHTGFYPYNVKNV
jgi:hypothetical protein